MGTHTQTQCARNKYSGVSVLQPQAASQAVSLLTPPVYTVPHWSVTPTANLLQQHLMPMSALWILADLSLVARTISIASEIIGQCTGRDRWNGTGVDGGWWCFCCGGTMWSDRDRNRCRSITAPAVCQSPLASVRESQANLMSRRLSHVTVYHWIQDIPGPDPALNTALLPLTEAFLRGSSSWGRL